MGKETLHLQKTTWVFKFFFIKEEPLIMKGNETSIWQPWFWVFNLGVFSSFWWMTLFKINASVKSVQIRIFFWSVFSCIQSKYRKIKTRKKLGIWTLFTQKSNLEPYQTSMMEVFSKNSEQPLAMNYTLYFISNAFFQLSLSVA